MGAARIANSEKEMDFEHLTRLNKILLEESQKIPRMYINGNRDNCYPGIINLSFEFIEGESLLMSLKNVALSSGSACTSASLEPSYVLRALGVNEELSHTSIRFSFGRFTTEEDVRFTASLLSDRVSVLRDMSPLWEFYLEGIDANTIEWTGGA